MTCSISRAISRTVGWLSSSWEAIRRLCFSLPENHNKNLNKIQIGAWASLHWDHHSPLDRPLCLEQQLGRQEVGGGSLRIYLVHFNPLLPSQRTLRMALPSILASYFNPMRWFILRETGWSQQSMDVIGLPTSMWCLEISWNDKRSSDYKDQFPGENGYFGRQTLWTYIPLRSCLFPNPTLSRLYPQNLRCLLTQS